MILTLLIALNNRSASCAAIAWGLALERSSAAAQISWARSRAHSRKIALQRDATAGAHVVSLSILIRAPSSTP